ncbi:hypothetical protein [Agathobaculum desmolans]|uniref:hypothetical protein n=1 Tax=Agathobaculum desmolans TaxID=39484 RepID=UPI00248D54D6|nr:hypothetical protein [Agathobaculum desmolans]
MSYTIEYDRQFIKSRHGITPCWLAGDNNVTEIRGGYERRARDWSVFYNLLGVTEEEIMAAVQSSLGGYGEHWRKGGKWVDDAGLIRWIKNGCKHAAALEDILALNHFSAVFCYVSVWGENQSRELERYVSNTAEFDRWIVEAKALIKAKRDEGREAFPIVKWGEEPLRHPDPTLTDETKVLIRLGKSYLSERPSDAGSSWSRDIRKSFVFTAKEAKEIIAANRFGWLAESTIVSAKRLEEPYNVVIRVSDALRECGYVFQKTATRIRLTNTAKNARHFANERAAEKAIKKYQKEYPNVQFAVELV